MAQSLRSQVCLLSVARSFCSQIFNTGPIHEQGRRQDFSLGGAVCAASEASKLWQGSAGAAPSGVQGRSPLAGARGAQPPGKFLRNRVFYTTFGIKEICRTAINWD